jgi:hypothetical protein
MLGEPNTNAAAGTNTSTCSGVAALLPLLREVNDLKRIRSAQYPSSWATRCFARSWKRIIAGEDIEAVALQEAARALAAARLADIDAPTMRVAGLSAEEALQVLVRSLGATGGALDTELSARLQEALGTSGGASSLEVNAAGAGVEIAQRTAEIQLNGLPEFVRLLIEQPRAGATRPGVGRVVLEPTEQHGDHCAIVAVNGVICAPLYGANPGDAFLTGLTHHLHNAWWPDAGDAGDNLVGDHLKPAMDRLRERAIEQLPESLRQRVRDSLSVVYRADTPHARAFQTADVLDRVLEMEWHARSAAFTLDVALGEMDIVHPGPVQSFQQDVMRASGLR